MKIRYFLGITFFASIFASCVPKSEYIQLQEENEALKKELELLKQTDEFYYKDAVDKFQRKEFEAALAELNELSLKFPQTSLKKDIDSFVVKINTELKLIYENEKKNKNDVLVAAKKTESLEDSIRILKKYADEKHPDEFLKEVKNQLEKYTEKYEKEKATIDLENKYGFKIIDYATGWRAKYLLSPEIDLKLQCLSTIKDNTKIKAVFKNTTKNEIFGEGTEYLSDNSTKNKGDIFTIYLESTVGFTSYVWEYPSMTVDIYLDDNFYKSYNIKKGQISGF